jgi:GNAT superfamily N-acetyltransferase
MNVEYRWSKNFEASELEELFLSLDWSSGRFPEELVRAMQGSDSVYSAWADGRLIGLMNALSDGAMTVYFHYLLVHPDAQKLGIGQRLVEGMLNRYRSYYRLVLTSYKEAVPFYEKCGFKVSTDGLPMGITQWSKPE